MSENDGSGDEGGLVGLRRLVAKEVQEGRGDVGQSGVGQVISERDLRGQVDAADGNRHRRQGVAGERHHSALLVHGGGIVLLGALAHVVSVAVVGCHKPAGAHLLAHLQKLADALVADLAGDLGGLKVPSVPHHVRVGKVDADHLVLARAHRLLGGLTDFTCLHEGGLVERHLVGGDLDIGLHALIKVAGAVAVPEESDVPKLLGFGAGKCGDPVLHQILPGRLADGRRRHEEVGRQLEVAVVLHEPGKLDLGEALTVEGIEVLVLKGLADLNHAVCAEVEDDDGVAVLNGPHRGAAVIGDDKGGQPLIGDRIVSRAPQRGDGLHGVVEGVGGLAQDVSKPALLHNVPVSLIAVHGDTHAASARGNLGVHPGSSQSLALLLQLSDKLH
mmetsp:Transcript_11540/g.32739  ORF Transcript_11540/g.32739 Transcript_11540/m.32739 type:complete len:388 (-) Transcript_11540:627-1790(-)